MIKSRPAIDYIRVSSCGLGVWFHSPRRIAFMLGHLVVIFHLRRFR